MRIPQQYKPRVCAAGTLVLLRRMVLAASLILLAAAAVVSAHAASGIAGGYNSPTDVVRQYLALDALGEPRSPATIERMQRLVTFQVETEVQPITVDVTSVYARYRILNSVVTANKATVDVEFDLIGSLTNYTDFEPQLSTTIRRFELVMYDKRWLLTHHAGYRSWKSAIHRIRYLQKQSFGHVREIEDEKERETALARLESNFIANTNDVIRLIEHSASLQPGSVLPSKYSVESIMDELYRNPDFDLSAQGRDLTTFLRRQSKETLRRIRNTIFARKNYQFDDPQLTEYFRKRFPSYKPVVRKYDMSETDKRNVQYMKDIEEYRAARDAAG